MTYAPASPVSSTKPFIQTNSFLRGHLLPVALGIGLLTLFSKIYIPLQPVPITLQTVAVMLIGLLYSRTNAIQTVAMYLALGALGMPVFAGPVAGMAKLIGPTGGYLVGFLSAVIVMTTLRTWLNKPTFMHQTALCVAGTVALFACGITWLTYLSNFEAAITAGILPLIVPSILKIGILVSMLKLYRLVRKG